MPRKNTKTKQLVWKQGNGWIQYDPPRNHPAYEDWVKLREKLKND